jgi:hypothetical protein
MHEMHMFYQVSPTAPSSPPKNYAMAAGCTATFDEYKVVIQKENNTLLLQGARNLQIGLWKIPWSKTSSVVRWDNVHNA